MLTASTSQMAASQPVPGSTYEQAPDSMLGAIRAVLGIEGFLDGRPLQ